MDDDDREAPIVLLTAGAPGVRCDVDGTAATGGAGGFGGMYGCCELVELGCGATGTTRRTLMKPIRSETPLLAARVAGACVWMRRLAWTSVARADQAPAELLQA